MTTTAIATDAKSSGRLNQIHFADNRTATSSNIAARAANPDVRFVRILLKSKGRNINECAAQDAENQNGVKLLPGHEKKECPEPGNQFSELASIGHERADGHDRPNTRIQSRVETTRSDCN